jgi:hypothetical protein
MPLPTDEEFQQVIDAVVAYRRSTRLTGMTVTELFKPILEKYQLAEFRDYLSNHYKFSRNEGFTRQDGSRKPKSEFVTIQNEELRKLHKKFLRDDGLVLSFDYTNDWSNITNFTSVVINGNTIPGPISFAFLLFFAGVNWMLDQLAKLLPKKD